EPESTGLDRARRPHRREEHRHRHTYRGRHQSHHEPMPFGEGHLGRFRGLGRLARGRGLALASRPARVRGICGDITGVACLVVVRGVCLTHRPPGYPQARVTTGSRVGRLAGMPTLNTAEVARLAALARIDLTDEETERLAGELDVIVEAMA